MLYSLPLIDNVDDCVCVCVYGDCTALFSWSELMCAVVSACFDYLADFVSVIDGCTLLPFLLFPPLFSQVHLHRCENRMVKKSRLNLSSSPPPLSIDQSRTHNLTFALLTDSVMPVHS